MYNSASDHTSLHFYADLSLTGIGVILQNLFVTVFRHQAKKKKDRKKSFCKMLYNCPVNKTAGCAVPHKEAKNGRKTELN